MTLDGFGQSPLRREDARLLRGEGVFTADIDLDGQAHMAVLRSPHAHADITAIDTQAAGAMPGVLAVLTSADAVADGLGALPGGDGLMNRDGSAPVSPPRPVIARERVRHVGEAVALVVAETLAQARDAAEAIVVDYSPRGAVGDIAAAVAPGAPLVWDEAAGNVSLDWEAGDATATERAFAEAAHVCELELLDNRVIVFPMEPVGAVGAYDAASRRYTLHTPSQGVHGVRETVAVHGLGIPESDLHVLTPDVGGGFGLRSGGTPEHVLLLWAARRVGRPVKWVAERSEAILADLAARDHLTRAALALDAEGRFLAIRVDSLANIGAYLTSYARNVPTVGYAAALSGTYELPAFHCRTRVVFSNTMMTNAYRGAGRPEGIYVTERLVDAAAAQIGMAPAELRRRNLVPATAMPYATVTGETYDSGDFEGCLDGALAAAPLGDAEQRRVAARRAGKRYGIGIASYVKINGGTPREAARLAFDADGAGISLAIGTQDNGQGHLTTYAQLVAEELGLPLGAVRMVQGDTDAVASGQGTGGSSSISVAGAALVQAAQNIVEAGKPAAGELLEAAVADIEFAAGRYVVAGTDRAVGLAEVARAAAAAGAGLDEQSEYVAAAKTYTNGCHVCEAEVDVETGRVEIVGYTVADDIGRVVNPMLAEGQVHGGLGQGIGQALVEHCIYDGATGQLLTGSLMDYCLPRAADLPSFAVVFNEVPCTTNPLAVKGVGEAGTTGALPAVVNAVVDALAEFGVRHVDMPVTSERVWRAIRAASG